MTTLKDQLTQLQTLEQQRQKLLQTIAELEQQQEELAKSILHSPHCPTETHVPIDLQTIAWIEHSDHWDDENLRRAIRFHDLTPIDVGYLRSCSSLSKGLAKEQKPERKGVEII